MKVFLRLAVFLSIFGAATAFADDHSLTVNFPALQNGLKQINVSFDVNGKPYPGEETLYSSNPQMTFNDDGIRVLNQLVGLNFGKENTFTFYNCGSSYCDGKSDAKGYYKFSVVITRSAHRNHDDEYVYTVTPSTVTVPAWLSNL